MRAYTYMWNVKVPFVAQSSHHLCVCLCVCLFIIRMTQTVMDAFHKMRIIGRLWTREELIKFGRLRLSLAHCIGSMHSAECCLVHCSNCHCGCWLLAVWWVIVYVFDRWRRDNISANVPVSEMDSRPIRLAEVQSNRSKWLSWWLLWCPVFLLITALFRRHQSGSAVAILASFSVTNACGCVF